MDDIIKREIASWTDIPEYLDFFQKREVLFLLELCDIVTHKHPRQEELIKDFILGLTGMALPDVPNKTQHMKICYKLMMPVMQLGAELIKSDGYKYDFLEKYIPGDTEIRNGNVVSKISAKALFILARDTDKILLTQNDIDELEKAFISHVNKRYSTVSNSYEQHAFQTNLTETERLKLCNDIIQNKGIVKDFEKSRPGKAIELEVFTGITKEHLETLIYLFGGKKPTRIKKIRMISHNNVYKLLLKYSSSTNKAGYPKLTDNFRTKFCPNVLCDRYGNTISELHHLVKNQV